MASIAPSKGYCRLNDGNLIPMLAFGTGTALALQDCEDAVFLALSTGVKHIDTAQSYRNEESVGRAVSKYMASGKASRSDLFITTKLTKPEEGQSVREALLVSLSKLQMDYVDLYLIHSPTKFSGRLAGIWAEFEGLKREGLARSIGVSNYAVKQYEDFADKAEIKPAVNQFEYHPYLLDTNEPIVTYQDKHRVITASYGGFVPLYAFPGGPLDAVLPPIQERLSRDAGLEVTDSQVLSKWLGAKNVVQVTTSSKKDRILSLLESFNLPDLTEKEVRAIDEAGKKIHYRKFGPNLQMDG